MISLFPYSYFSSILSSVFINILNQFFDSFGIFNLHFLQVCITFVIYIDLYKKSMKFHHILNSVLYYIKQSNLNVLHNYSTIIFF